MNDLANQSTLVSTLIKGGWTMVPLVLCSVVGLAIILERLFWGPRRKNVAPEALYREIKLSISQGKIGETLGLCRAQNSALSRLTVVILENVNRSKAEITEIVKSAGKKEALDIQKRISVLGTIASIGPLLGLLGTVFGMIATFSAIHSEGMGNAAALAGGISEALITTATGLTIAIPAMVSFRSFSAHAKTLIAELEDMTQQILDTVIAVRDSQESDIANTTFRKSTQFI